MQPKCAKFDFKSHLLIFSSQKNSARFIFKILEGTNKAAKRREKYGCVSFDEIQGKIHSLYVVNRSVIHCTCTCM